MDEPAYTYDTTRLVFHRGSRINRITLYRAFCAVRRVVLFWRRCC